MTGQSPAPEAIARYLSPGDHRSEEKERDDCAPILTHVAPDPEVGCREVFGPVVVLHPYRDLPEAIDAVNASEYGLQAGFCTRDMGRAFEAARRLRVGGVMVNDVPTFRADPMPYGGVKKSGIGREGPHFVVKEMTELKLICWRGWSRQSCADHSSPFIDAKLESQEKPSGACFSSVPNPTGQHYDRCLGKHVLPIRAFSHLDPGDRIMALVMIGDLGRGVFRCSV